MAKSAHELIDDRYGVRTRAVQQPEGTTAETTVAILARANPQRVGLLVVNTSAADIYVRPGGIASANESITLVPNGSLSVTILDDFSLPTLEWSVLSASGSQAIFTLSTEIEP